MTASRNDFAHCTVDDPNARLTNPDVLMLLH